MRDRRDPWKWPFSIGMTLVVFLGSVFLLPQPWIDAFFSPLSLDDRLEPKPAAPWMAILPPPAIEAVPDRRPEPTDPEPEPERDPFHQDPAWWTRGWTVRADPDRRTVGPAAVQDSVAILLAALGVERDFISRSRPDSILAARLFLLRVEDSLNFDELKPYLRAMGRSRDYADLYSRVADMYDNFLAREIMTPD